LTDSLSPEPAVPAYSTLRMHWKRPEVLGIGLNRPESSCRPTASVYRASQRHPVLLERAADPLYGARINSKLFGNDADTGPSRSRQSLTDSLSSVGAIGGRPRRLPSSLARARPARTRS